jgi:flotillin
MLSAIPPMQDLFKMAGMELPDYLKGKEKIEDISADTPETDTKE